MSVAPAARPYRKGESGRRLRGPMRVGEGKNVYRVNVDTDAVLSNNSEHCNEAHYLIQSDCRRANLQSGGTSGSYTLRLRCRARLSDGYYGSTLRQYPRTFRR
jgi:hypothetical protein